MNSTYELGLLGKLAYKRTLESAQMRRLARSANKRKAVTNDVYQQFAVCKGRPCHC